MAARHATALSDWAGGAPPPLRMKVISGGNIHGGNSRRLRAASPRGGNKSPASGSHLMWGVRRMQWPGRKRRIDELVESHYASLYRYAYRLSGSPQEAEDLTQETFCQAQ